MKEPGSNQDLKVEDAAERIRFEEEVPAGEIAVQEDDLCSFEVEVGQAFAGALDMPAQDVMFPWVERGAVVDKAGQFGIEDDLIRKMPALPLPHVRHRGGGRVELGKQTAALPLLTWFVAGAGLAGQVGE